MEYFLANIFPKVYFSFSINAAPQFLSMSWSLSKRTLELKSWWLFNWICLQTNDEDLISAKLLHENWNALGYTQVCSSTWTRIFNSFWQMLPIGLEPSELMISMILALQRSKNWETWKYFFIDFCKCQFYAQLKKPDWKYYWYLHKNAIQSQFFAHYSVPKQKESMNIKRNTYTVWENHLKSLIQNGEWSELRWHFH